MLCFGVAQSLVKSPLVFTLAHCCYNLTIKLARILCRLLLLRVPISVKCSCSTSWLYISNSAVSSLRYRDWNYMYKLCYVQWMPWILSLEVEERLQSKTRVICCVLFGVDDLKFGVRKYWFCNWVTQHFILRSRDCFHMH